MIVFSCKISDFQVNIQEKTTLFPKLARFHFQNWRVFTSKVGAFSLPKFVAAKGLRGHSCLTISFTLYIYPFMVAYRIIVGVRRISS